MIGKTYKICLFGHRDFCGYRILDVELFKLIKEIMETNNYIEIYIGRNGEFDIYAASVIKRVESCVCTHNIEFVCVLPYYSKDVEFYSEYYDSVIIPESVWGSHPKSAITKRNRWMVDICDLVICYVENTTGGAYRAMQYALKSNKQGVNLADKT